MDISAKHPPLTLLDSWIDVKKTCNATSPPYCHILIRQSEDINPEVWDEIFAYIDHAHAGARQALRAPLEDSLHPLQHNTEVDPAFGYPHMFGDTALQGFFGEIIAGIVAEYYTGDDEQKWEVPVYLFRTHVVAFQQLELMKQTNNWERQVVGRTGDDGLAFTRDENGGITAWLACEAKCTAGHSSELIKENHIKLSQPVTRPIDLLRVIDALKDYRDDQYTRDWRTTLIQFYWKTQTNPDQERCDLSVYVCAQLPRRSACWVPNDRPHHEYTGNRSLTAAELHLPDVINIIQSLYGRMNNPT